jgi:uncharacterized HAD superfamily protein
MNIGIDIDDTITETYSTIIPMVAVKYDLDLGDLIRTKPSYKTLEKSLVNYDSFMAEYFPTMAKIVPLKKDVIEVLNKLRNDGHKIIFITARNRLEYKDPFKISKEYLDTHNVPYDKLIAECHDKGKQAIIEGIDLFIDDNNNNCRAVHKAGIETLQFGTIFTKKLKNIERVESWQEVYNFVTNKETKN